VGDLPLDLQAKLLRVLQEGEFEPVGSSRVQKVDVRIIAATNRDLEQASRAREFREDLFYRLNVFPIRVPPLRERGADVGLLARAFAGKYAQRMGRSLEPLSSRDLELLAAYQWPGNVRELQNVMERAVITSQDGRLNLGHALPGARADRGVPHGLPGGEPSPQGTDDETSVTPPRILTISDLRELERQNIIAALDACAGKVAGKQGAAARLGMKPSTLASRMKALGVVRPG
jgi:transcriptional regulator with GAF, ATPase, and Fis domain